jgi:hypothetical protein
MSESVSESESVQSAVRPRSVAETGHPGVDAALARLDELDGVPTEAHAQVFEDVHQRLRGTLSALDAPHPSPSRS